MQVRLDVGEGDVRASIILDPPEVLTFERIDTSPTHKEMLIEAITRAYAALHPHRASMEADSMSTPTPGSEPVSHNDDPDSTPTPRDFDFQREHDGSLSIDSAVFQALGAASVCWESMAHTGIFNDRLAKLIGDRLLVEIDHHVQAKMDHLLNATGPIPVHPQHPVTPEFVQAVAEEIKP